MGTKASLAAATLAASHSAQAYKNGRSASGLTVQAQQQINDLIVLLKEITKDMQVGDPNIATFQTLTTNLS